MKVTVMYRNNFHGGDGWTYYPVVINISDTCPVCGEKRGEPKNHRFCEDDEWYDVNVWENACGHIDKYKDCLIEAGYIKVKDAA